MRYQFLQALVLLVDDPEGSHITWIDSILRVALVLFDDIF